MRRRYVASTSLRRHVPTRFLINQCQIISVFIIKSDIIENSRIELRGIVLPVQVGGLLGGPKGILAPPLKLLGGGLAPPLPTPMNFCQMVISPAMGLKMEGDEKITSRNNRKEKEIRNVSASHECPRLAP